MKIINYPTDWYKSDQYERLIYLFGSIATIEFADNLSRLLAGESFDKITIAYSAIVDNVDQRDVIRWKHQMIDKADIVIGAIDDATDVGDIALFPLLPAKNTAIYNTSSKFFDVISYMATRFGLEVYDKTVGLELFVHSRLAGIEFLDLNVYLLRAQSLMQQQNRVVKPTAIIIPNGR